MMMTLGPLNCRMRQSISRQLLVLV